MPRSPCVRHRQVRWGRDGKCDQRRWISGGVFTPEGKLYCTGHDNAEVYVLTFPTGGSTLVLEETIPMPMHGQGIALDPGDSALLYGIDRPRREIVVTRVG